MRIALRLFVVPLVLVAIADSASTAHAMITGAQRCTAREIDAAGRGAMAHLACHVRALRQGKAVRPRCHVDADVRLDAAFARVEAVGGCPFPGVLGPLDVEIDALADDLLAVIPPGRCGAAKLRAASRKVYESLGCHRVAVRRGAEPDPACEARALARLTEAFARIERRFACDTLGDAAAVAAVVDAFVEKASTLLVQGPNAVSPAPDDLSATIDGADVDLEWTGPSPASGNTHVRILRRQGAAPTDASDPLAAVVFFGTGTTATDAVAALLPGTAYHYAAFGCTAGGDCESTGSRTTLTPTLVEALRAGGYVLHWRHAAADICSDKLALGTAATTSSPDWWKSCDAVCSTATARQMNAVGVAQSTTIGQQFDRLGIPVGRVLSSEYCRNFTTAELMDFGPTIELRPDITYFVYDEAGRCDASYALLDDVPAAGTNTAIIGHAGFTPACPVLSELAWGEAAIFKPDGQGGEVLVGRVVDTAWAGF